MTRCMSLTRLFTGSKNLYPTVYCISRIFVGSSTVYLCAMIAISVYTSIVIASFLLYTALVVSPVREMKDKHIDLALTAFNRIAMPVVSLLYLALIGASVAVFWGFIALMRNRCPNFALVEANLRQYALPIGGILCFGGLLSSIVAVVVCFHTAMKQHVDTPVRSGTLAQQRMADCLATFPGQQPEHTTVFSDRHDTVEVVGSGE
mmetsp:Transcript_14731/g.47366  ORF Transcript_14731/g.47366 Transcript_14731/m.47366 type:complete len:205 (+) Transcript_14731:387-1001(+)